MNASDDGPLCPVCHQPMPHEYDCANDDRPRPTEDGLPWNIEKYDKSELIFLIREYQRKWLGAEKQVRTLAKQLRRQRKRDAAWWDEESRL